jgi:hypothetical protein
MRNTNLKSKRRGIFASLAAAIRPRDATTNRSASSRVRIKHPRRLVISITDEFFQMDDAHLLPGDRLAMLSTATDLARRQG